MGREWCLFGMLVMTWGWERTSYPGYHTYSIGELNQNGCRARFKRSDFWYDVSKMVKMIVQNYPKLE